MAETRAHRSQKPEEFTRETAIEIEAIRAMGTTSAEDIANALNRSGYTNWRGHQWDADQVLSFLAQPGIDRLMNELRR